MARFGPGRVDVDINNRAIDAMFSGSVGEVVNFAKDLARDVHTFSNVTYRKQGIGVRSGNLQRHTKMGGVLKVGPYQCRTSVYNDADYAAAVHDGTAGLAIRPTNSKAMPVPKVRGTWGPVPRFPVGPRFKKKFVKGQRAKPWLDDAMVAVVTQL